MKAGTLDEEALVFKMRTSRKTTYSRTAFLRGIAT